MKKTALLIVVALISISSLKAQSRKRAFKDSIDNAFDVSVFITEQKGLLPTPMIVTEPAIGYGGGLALAYFHSSIMEKGNIPDISSGFGGLTENGTWWAGFFHLGFWNEDRIRYMGLLAKADVNYQYFGPNSVLPQAVEMNLDTWMLIQQIKFRMADTDFFSGLRYFYYGGTNTLSLPIDIPEFKGKSFNSTLSEVSLIMNYDSRDNVFSPRKGLMAELRGTYSDKWVGGSDLYGRLSASLLAFGDISEKATLGLRLETAYATKNTPFWSIPGINLRGVPAAKYQANNVSLSEVQINYSLNYRWQLLGFTGIGLTAPLDEGFLNYNKSVQSVGTGFRYLLARVFGLQAGMDFAWSNDDFGFYFVVGHAWAR